MQDLDLDTPNFTAEACINHTYNKTRYSVRLQITSKRGARCYIAVAGGINTPAYLGSRSTFPGGKLGGIQARHLTAMTIMPVHSKPIGLLFQSLQNFYAGI